MLLVSFALLSGLTLTRSKYPLAIVAKMLDVFGADLGQGYDIGCSFGTTLDNSPLGPKARENNVRISASFRIM